MAEEHQLSYEQGILKAGEKLAEVMGYNLDEPMLSNEYRILDHIKSDFNLASLPFALKLLKHISNEDHDPRLDGVIPIDKESLADSLVIFVGQAISGIGMERLRGKERNRRLSALNAFVLDITADKAEPSPYPKE